MTNPMKFHSQVESSSTMESGGNTHPPQQQTQLSHRGGSSSPNSTQASTTTHVQANFKISRTTTNGANSSSTTTSNYNNNNNNGDSTSSGSRLSPSSASSSSSSSSNNHHVVSTNVGSNNTPTSPSTTDPSLYTITSSSGDNNNLNTTPTIISQITNSLGFSIGNRRGSSSQPPLVSRNSAKSPTFFQHGNDPFLTNSQSLWANNHKGPILVVRVSRIDHLNVYPSSSSDKTNNSTLSNTSTPTTPINNKQQVLATTSTTTSNVSSSENFSNYNPHVVVGYGRLKTLKNESEEPIPIFEQKTKTLTSEVFPIYNTVLEFPLLTMDASARGKKISELIKHYPDQLFSSEAHQHADTGDHIEDTTVLSFKVLSHNRYKKKQESLIAVAELNLGDLPHITNDEKIFLKMRKPGEPLKKTDMIYGGEVLPENQPILHLDIKVVWNDRHYKTVGDDESSTSFDKWNDILTQFYIQEMGEDDNDPMFAMRPEDRVKSLERLLNQCELTKFLTFPVPHSWHLIGKPDKLILVSPTQLTNEEVFTDNVNVYYVYESKTRNVLEEMLKNSERRSNFSLTMPLHNFKMLSNWKGFRFSCYYSLYNKIYHQNVIGIQTKIGISYILQYVSNCGSPNQPVFDKMLERLTLLPSIYSKELERGKIWCGAVPCAWRGVSKDSIIHLYSPFQCNGKLNCTDQILLQPFVNNMSTMERIRFILKKYMDDPDFEGLEILHGPLATDLNDHINSVLDEESNNYKDLEQLENSENVDLSYEPEYWTKKRKELPESLNISKDNIEEATTIIFSVRMKAKPPTNMYDVPPPTTFSNSYLLYQKTVVMKMKNVDYQLHIGYKTTLNSHLVSEGAFNRLIQSIKLT